jgi:cysteine desulfurase
LPQNYNDDNRNIKGSENMIYLDYSATTPMSDQALHIYNEVAKNYFGNPSSLHDIGSMADQLLQTCREELASCIQGEGRGIYFTGGGSESNYLAIRSLVKAHEHKGKHLITSSIEHASVLNTFKLLEEEGFQVTYLPVTSYGEVLLVDLESALTEETILVSIAHANSEIGTIQPIEAIGDLLERKQILFHSDCVQSFGKLPIDVRKAKLTSISISSHKVYGPKGVGACYISADVQWKEMVPDTTHEKGFRQGTVNLPGIAGFVTAAQEVVTHIEQEATRCRTLTQQLLQGVRGRGWKVVLEGHPDRRLPQHLGLRLPGMEGQYAMLELNRYGIAISTGTACLASLQGPSSTMLAIAKTNTEANEFIRITIGQPTKESDIERTIDVFHQILTQYFRGGTNEI